jgi:hypothetical protein
MGHKIYIAYEDSAHPPTKGGEFFGGLFAGTLAFMTTIGGWLVTLFCWLGLEASLSWVLAAVLSVCAGIAFGIGMARDCASKKEKLCETK